MSLTARMNNSRIKKLHLTVRGDKYPFFMELIKNLDFVKVEKENTSVAKHQKEELTANIRQGFADKKSIEKGKLKTFPIEKLFDD